MGDWYILVDDVRADAAVSYDWMQISRCRVWKHRSTARRTAVWSAKR